MKKILFIFTIIGFTITSNAQNSIDASEIMKDIANGKDINLKNTTIHGTLDFTFMSEAMKNLPEKKKSSWWGGSNYSNTVEKMIDVTINFENCTFKNDVLAYIPDEKSGYTFTASFEKDVVFKKCNFYGKAMFKYSTFERNGIFAGSQFKEDSTFKYAKFERDSSFENTFFAEIATFKYTEFDTYVSFANSIFEDTAIFKYTKFFDGVTFSNTKFEEDLDIKYMKVKGSFSVKNMKVAYNIDSKYTEINGRGFSKYLLDN